jgi:hypothetical protein
MRIERWLVIARPRHPNYTAPVTMVAKEPKSLPHAKVAVKLIIDLPDNLFARPNIVASVRVPDEVVTPPRVDAETLVQVQEAFEASGLRVELIVGEPKL